MATIAAADKTILVTGGAGFIGSHTCLVLTNLGYKVVIVDNYANSLCVHSRISLSLSPHPLLAAVGCCCLTFSPPSLARTRTPPAASPESIDRVKLLSDHPENILALVECDITDEAALDAVFTTYSFDAVIHFAGLRFVGESVKHPIDYYHANLQGSLVLFRLMVKHGVKAIAFSSSGTVYGGSASPLSEATSETGSGILNPYSFSKYVIERMLKDVHTANPDMRVAVLRYFNPVGAHESGTIGEDPNGVPTSLFPYTLQVLTGRRPKLTVFGSDFPTRDGTCIRDYVHVVDIARGHADAIAWLNKDENAAGVFDSFNFGTGTGSTGEFL